MTWWETLKYIAPKNVGGGAGGGDVPGSAVIKYTQNTDPKGPEFTLEPAIARHRPLLDVDFELAVARMAQTILADVPFTLSVEARQTLFMLASFQFTVDSRHVVHINDGPSFTFGASMDQRIAAEVGFDLAADMKQHTVAMGVDWNAAPDRLRVRTSQKLADKDSFVPRAQTLGSCNDTANYDTNDLLTSSLVTDNDAHAYCGWDVSAWGTADVVNEAVLYLKPSINSNLVAVNRELGFLSAYATQDNWNETTITCPNAPSIVNTQTFSQPTGTAEVSVTLDADFRTVLEMVLGVRPFTVVVSDPSGTGNPVTYESKDEGTNDAQGPRLTLDYDLVTT